MQLTATDGLSLHVTVSGPEGAPVILAIHGYPDDSSLWDGVAALLSDRFRFVRYDVRGAGQSGVPAQRSGYLLDQLVRDVRTVADAVSPDAPVHLLAHDWGSIQGWHAVTSDWADERIATWTSISGAHLDTSAAWLRKGRGGALKQLRHSWYMLFFKAPLLPVLAWRSGAFRAVVARSEGRAVAGSWSVGDGVRGLELYRANILTRTEPAPPPTSVPTQVIMPTGDAYVTEALQRAMPASDVVFRPVTGRHWIARTNPSVVARMVEELVTGTVPRQPLAVITGGGSGIGRETAKAFAAKGHRVVVCDLHLDTASTTAREVGGAAYAVDVADEAAVQDFAKQVIAEHGVPDVIVNNAGIGMAGGFLDTGVEDWDRIIDINLRGVINGCRAFLPAMVERGEGGHVVNLSSVLGYLPSRETPAYAVTKAGVLMLSQCLEAEFAEHDIHVSAICPGVVHTNIITTSRFLGRSAAEEAQAQQKVDKLYARRHYTPDKVAAQIVRAVQERRVVVPVTPESKVAYALSRISPALLRTLASKELIPS
jgi:NAD(P)-dependent dehydrogenase (short-subunit alcohol dehydrogenase family)/pimeloyl-ACP methyl ester carboxylesterase